MLVTFGEGEVTKTSSDEFLVGDASDIQYDQASEILDSAELPDGHLIRNNIHDGKDGWTLLEISDIPVTDIPDTDSYQKNVDGYLSLHTALTPCLQYQMRLTKVCSFDRTGSNE